MNPKQKLAFLLGVVAIACMGLNPPWKESGPKGLPVSYAPIFAPPTPVNPDRGLEIDFARLLLQISVAGILCGGLIAAAAPPPAQGSQPRGAIPSITIEPPTPTMQFDPLKVEEEDDGAGDEVKDTPNVVRLPAGKARGEFLVESDDDPEYWETFAEARGVIHLPLGKRVQLEVKDEEDFDLSFVSSIAPTILHSVDLSESGVEDSDLTHLQRFAQLKELDLSSTKVSNAAIANLKELKKLEKLWLDGTQVDDSCIEELKGLKSLKKISLKETKVTEDGINKLKESLARCVIES